MLTERYVTVRPSQVGQLGSDEYHYVRVLDFFLYLVYNVENTARFLPK